MLQMGVEGFGFHFGIVGKALQIGEIGKEGLARRAEPGGVLCRLAGDAGAELVIHPQKGLPVIRDQGKAEDICQVPGDAVGEEGQVALALPVGDVVSLQQVDQGQGAVVVPVENGSLLAAVLGHLEKVTVLRPPVPEGDLPHRFAAAAGGNHGLGMAGGVEADEAVRRSNDGGGGAEVGLHQQYPGAGVVFFKVQQGLGAGGPEAVDALIFVSHQEQISGGKEVDDGVLDPGGVLGLVHAQVRPPPAQQVQDIRAAAQNGEGVDHLVVIVHEGAGAEGLVVGPVEGGEVVYGLSQIFDALSVEHLVFRVSDGALNGFDIAVRGEILGDVPVELADQAGALPLVTEKVKGLAAPALLVEADDPGADTVDGAKLQPPGQLLSEDGGKALLHVPGGGDGVGHGEDIFRRHAPAQNEVSQPQHQDGGFAAAGNGQQKDRPLRGAEGGELLVRQGGGVFGFKSVKGHGVPRKKRFFHDTTPAVVFPQTS